jgi:hypothetical protein
MSLVRRLAGMMAAVLSVGAGEGSAGSAQIIGDDASFQRGAGRLPGDSERLIARPGPSVGLNVVLAEDAGGSWLGHEIPGSRVGAPCSAVLADGNDCTPAGVSLLTAEESNPFFGLNRFGREGSADRGYSFADMPVAADALPGNTGALVTAAPGHVTWLEKAAYLAAIRYYGSYDCPRGQGLTAVVLLVAGGNAVFSFRAHPANPGVPSGSISMRGKVDLAGGVMRLAPVRWITRPDDSWVMVGLEGESHDGGLTFRGRVLSPYCTGFSLTRAH